MDLGIFHNWPLPEYFAVFEIKTKLKPQPQESIGCDALQP